LLSHPDFRLACQNAGFVLRPASAMVAPDRKGIRHAAA
jgi:hypothetical protein